MGTPRITGLLQTLSSRIDLISREVQDTSVTVVFAHDLFSEFSHILIFPNCKQTNHPSPFQNVKLSDNITAKDEDDGEAHFGLIYSSFDFEYDERLSSETGKGF